MEEDGPPIPCAKGGLQAPKKGTERLSQTAEEWLRGLEGDAVDPENYAGENFSDPDEIANIGDIDNPWLRAKVAKPGYWPGQHPKPKRKKK